MDPRCPGLSGNKGSLDSKLVRCSKCGNMVELFGDEVRVRCRCGQWVFGEALPACFQWCESAKQCMGTIEDFSQLMQKIEGAPDLEEQKRRLHELRMRIDAATEKCSNPEEREQRDDQRD